MVQLSETMLEEIQAGFLQAIAFSNWECPDWDQGGTTLSEEMLAEIKVVVERFIEENSETIQQYKLDYPEQGNTEIGHDLYFNLAGHGVGFWEQDSPAATTLSQWCTTHYYCECYAGDDDLLYVLFSTTLFPIKTEI